MEINVGDYVRDKNGRIGKVFDITNEPSVDVGIGIIPEVNAVWIDKDKINYLYQEEITKHSKDIIDVIEAGDYVNGYKVSFKDNDYKSFVQCDYPVQEGTTNHYRFYEEEIYHILTHEQFEADAYVLESVK